MVETHTVPPWPGWTLSMTKDVFFTVVSVNGNWGCPSLGIWKTWYPVALATAPQSRVTVTVAVALGAERVLEPSVPTKIA